MPRPRRLVACTGALLALAGATAATAHAEFPYELPPNGVPNDLGGKLEWMYAATPEAGNEPNNSTPGELGGVRGAHLVDAEDGVDTAWETTTGRPDVAIAVLDSGIKWNDAGAMVDLRNKTRLTRAEVPQPLHDRATPLEALPGALTCAGFAAADDANGDGVFSVSDYACDSRVEIDPAVREAEGRPRGVGPADMLDPQDVLIAFTDGDDDDANGYADDIVGWDFLDDDNDPYDDVQYGHGTGEARDSTAEANNGPNNELGACPNCMSIHMRVGDSFVADENRFAQATIYAADNDVLVVQEALGTLNHTELARRAIEYAYRHGVVVIASAADEAAQHHNWPSSNPHVIQVNSVTKYDETFTAVPKSYLQFNGCTNFAPKITLAIPSVSCSSDATGRGSGMAGLVYSAALQAIENGDLEPHSDCVRTNGDPCPISANEVRQLMASGGVGGTPMADDVDLATTELSCNPVPLDPCTDPNRNSVNATPLVAPFPLTTRYPSRAGHDMFFGYGRVNMNRVVDTVDAGRVPPEVEITAPDWYQQIDPGQAAVDVRGEVASRSGSYTCTIAVAPGSQPNNPDDFEPVQSEWCDGSERTDPFAGVLGTIDVAALKAQFPASAGSFDGREPGTLGQSSNGRPNTDPYGFTVKVEAESTVGGAAMTGEDRRNMYLHRDADMLPGFPRFLDSDGESSPVLYDLDGDNRTELVFATADGDVHAMRPDGSELPGWPVRGDALPLHTGGRAFESGEIDPGASHGAFLASVAVGDLDGDGAPEVVGADFEGRVFAWSAAGERIWQTGTNLDFSGRPLSPFVDARQGKANRTQRGFLGSPVLADIDRNDSGRLEVVAAAMDRHVYAWNHDGSPVPNWPVLVVDRTKVESVDPDTHAVTFNANAGDLQNQGAIVDTPAIGDITGDDRPEIVVGTNEEYLVTAPGEDGLNAGGLDTAILDPLAEVGGLDLAHGRLYALSADGDPDGNVMTGPAPYLDGFPFKVGRLLAELLPVVGEGITGSPVIGQVDCPTGGSGPKIGVIPDAGIGYIVNPDGTSCYGEQSGKDVGLDVTPPAAPNTDAPLFPAVGHPAFGELDGETVFLAPAAGLRRALDLGVNEYQAGSQDFVAAWNASSGSFRTGFPAVVNDLQFLTGPSVADIDGAGSQEIVAGTASMDLAALGSGGAPASGAWPKLTGDWMVANPAIGGFGVYEPDEDARKSVIAFTRAGTLLAYGTDAPACSDASWPRFHHDPANSGDARRDAMPPGTPEALRIEGGELVFRAPGDDLMCGQAASYEVVTGGSAPGAAAFRRAGAVEGVEPVDAGAVVRIPLPAGSDRFVSVRALDDQGNGGRFATLDRFGGAGPGGTTGRKRCVARRVPISGNRIGPARLGARLSALTRRFRVIRRTRRATRLCVRGGGRFLVAARRGRIDLVATNARRHGTRRHRRGTRLAGGRLRGATKVRRGLYAGRRTRRGRVIYGARRGRIRFVAVVTKKQVARPKRLALRLRALRL